MSQFEVGYKFEKFEDYFGDIKQVQRIIDECRICGSKLVFTHLSDYSNMLVQESGRCPECGDGSKKLIHIIN